MIKYLSRDDILDAQDFRTDEVDVTEEWGGKVLVRELSAPEMLKVGFRVAGEKDEEGKAEINLAEFAESIPAMISWCVIDKNSMSILSEDDVNRLSARSIEPVNRIFAKIVELSDLAPESDENEDKDAEAKNG